MLHPHWQVQLSRIQKRECGLGCIPSFFLAKNTPLKNTDCASGD